MTKKPKQIPVFTTGHPSIPSLKLSVPLDQPVYSAHTGKLIKYGPIYFNEILCDVSDKIHGYVL